MNIPLRRRQSHPPDAPPVTVPDRGPAPAPTVPPPLLVLPRCARLLPPWSRLRQIVGAVLLGRALTSEETAVVAKTLLGKTPFTLQRGTAEWICATGAIDPADGARLGKQLSAAIEKQLRSAIPRSVARAWMRGTNFAALVAICIQLGFHVLVLPGAQVGSAQLLTLVHMGNLPAALRPPIVGWPPWLAWTFLATVGYITDLIIALVCLLVAYPMWPCWLGLSYVLDSGLRVRTRHQVTALSHLRLPLSAPQLAAIASMRSYRNIGMQGLARVVPLVGEEHYGRLSSREVSAMCKALHYAREAERTMLLRAIGAVGDTSALDALRVYVRRKAVRDSPELLQECYTAIEIIGQRIEQQTAPGMLLRPADNAGPGHLLRASEPHIADDGTLLQASVGPE